jgi:hypothetical protein
MFASVYKDDNTYFEDFFQYLVNMYGDEENIDDEIK